MLAATGARAVLNGRPVLVTVMPQEPLGVLGDPPAARPLLEDAAEIIFTSGSTGEPKGVVVGAPEFGAKIAALGAMLPVPANTMLVLQLTFIFGQWVSFLTLIGGGRLVMRDRFDPPALLDELDERRISHVALVPTMLRALLPVAVAPITATQRTTELNSAAPRRASQRALRC